MKGGCNYGRIEPTAGWTNTQPWRGLLGMAITLGIAFTVTAAFDMKTYLGFFATILMSNVPILVILTLGLQCQFPSTEGLPRPWGAFLMTAFVMVVGFIISYALLSFVAAGAATPFIYPQAILTVIVTFFLVIAFGTWPFHKFPVIMKQPALGIVLTITCFILGLILHFIVVGALKIAPLIFLLYGICYLFGLLMFMTMLQMWTSRSFSKQ